MGSLHLMEYAAMEDRTLGLRAHLASNFYPPLPLWVRDRIMAAFKKHWNGKATIEDVMTDLVKGTSNRKFPKDQRGPILRTAEAVDRYFGPFFDTEDEE